MQRLKTLRTQRHETQQQLADLLGVDRTTYTKYETGANEPSLDTLRRLAAHFDCSIDYLLGVTDAPGQSAPAPQALPLGVDVSQLTDAELTELEDFARVLLARHKKR